MSKTKSPQPVASSTQSTELREELYKHLIQENSKYIEKVHQTWNQKLLIVGAMAAVTIADKGVSNTSPIPLQIVLLAIPVMCVMLDAHLLEKALQARIISNFLIAEFEKNGTTPPWFRTLWSIGTPSPAANPFWYFLRFCWPRQPATRVDELVGMRSAATSVVSIVPTVLVFFLAAFSISRDYPSGYLVAAGLSLVYFVIAYLWFGALSRPVEGEE